MLVPRSSPGSQEPLAQRFTTWRAGRRRGERIPEELWQAAAEHARHEASQPIGNAHHIHAKHPLPVSSTVLPNETHRRHARVIEQEMNRAKFGKRPISKLGHLLSVGDVGLDGQHAGAAGGKLGSGPL